MTLRLLPWMLLMLCTALFHACKEEDEDPGLSAETKQFNDDSNTIKSESDQADNDINSLLQDIPAFGRVLGVETIPVCGVTVDSSMIAQKIIFLNFDSTLSCLIPARRRSGQIKVELTQGNYWRDPGAELTITYIQFKVTRVSDGKSITLNGVKKLTNINGNNWLGFLTGTDTLKYRSRAFSVQVSFTGGFTATWNVAHLTEWTYRPAAQEVVFTATGDTTYAGYASTSSWGRNRFQQNFITIFHTPWVSKSTCGYGRPVSGDLAHRINDSRFEIILGVDQNGNAVSSGCAYGYQVGWYYNGNHAGTAVFPY